MVEKQIKIHLIEKHEKEWKKRKRVVFKGSLHPKETGQSRESERCGILLMLLLCCVRPKRVRVRERGDSLKNGLLRPIIPNHTYPYNSSIPCCAMPGFVFIFNDYFI